MTSSQLQPGLERTEKLNFVFPKPVKRIGKSHSNELGFQGRFMLSLALEYRPDCAHHPIEKN